MATRTTRTTDVAAPAPTVNATPGADDGYTTPDMPPTPLRSFLDALRRGSKPRTTLSKKAIPTPDAPSGTDYGISCDAIPADGTTGAALQLFHDRGAKARAKNLTTGYVYSGTLYTTDAYEQAAAIGNLPSRE